jgi:hypothetical protein
MNRTDNTSDPVTGEPRLAAVASWAVLTASFGLSASTWIALAKLAGFTATLSVSHLGITLSMAWLMPVAVDGYVVVALVLWMAPVPAKVAEFAKHNTYGAASIGIAAQSAYHLLFTLSTTGSAWRVVMAAVVGALPPAVAGLAVHMRALIRRESNTTTNTATISTAAQPATRPAPDVSPTTVRLSTVSTPDPAPATSTVDTPPARPVPAPLPAPVPVPTPAVLAERITATRTTTPATPAAAPRPASGTTRPRTSTPAPRASTLAPSTTDISVTASDAAQLALPVVPPDLLARVDQVAKEYQAEHGRPITAGQLAVRLRVTSELATLALAQLDQTPDNPTTPTPTVNGTPTRVSR